MTREEAIRGRLDAVPIEESMSAAVAAELERVHVRLDALESGRRAAPPNPSLREAYARGKAMPADPARPEPCACTQVQQDETCPVDYPSLLCDACDGKGVVPARPEPVADVVREVVEAARALHAEIDGLMVNDATMSRMHAALAAYDASPPADPAAIRDAALEEARRLALSYAEDERKAKLEDRAQGRPIAAQARGHAKHEARVIAAGIAALRTSPAPEPVTEEELKAELMHMSFATHATVAGFIAERFAGRTITRKPKEG
jgi:hypothetical protein